MPRLKESPYYDTRPPRPIKRRGGRASTRAAVWGGLFGRLFIGAATSLRQGHFARPHKFSKDYIRLSTGKKKLSTIPRQKQAKRAKFSVLSRISLFPRQENLGKGLTTPPKSVKIHIDHIRTIWYIGIFYLRVQGMAGANGVRRGAFPCGGNAVRGGSAVRRGHVDPIRGRKGSVRVRGRCSRGR